MKHYLMVYSPPLTLLGLAIGAASGFDVSAGGALLFGGSVAVSLRARCRAPCR